jgi:Na+-transporting methylmalonyl-CoA/oxaloacetate decarboxylase gamma subunit
MMQGMMHGEIAGMMLGMGLIVLVLIVLAIAAVAAPMHDADPAASRSVRRASSRRSRGCSQ